MQAWQIEATPDGHVRWISSTVDRVRLRRSPESEETLGCSMDDLLLEAWPKIQGEECVLGKEEEEKLRGKEDQCTMFCTGLGRSVPMSRSSIEKAKAVLEVSKDEGHINRGAQFGTLQRRLNLVCKETLVLENHNIDGGSGDRNGELPMFQSGLGQPVSVKQSSVEKARALLENHSIDEVNEDVQMFATGSGRPILVNQSSMEKARGVLGNHNNDEVPEDIPMLVTASGRPVSVNQSSVHSARAVLGSYNDEEYGEHPMFATGLGGPISVSKSSIQKAQTVLENYNNAHGGDVPMFSTGSGRPVLVKKSSLQKARAVLDSHKSNEEHEDGLMFSTGSGRPVLVNQSSIHKAWALLENHNNDHGCGSAPGQPFSDKQSSFSRTRAVLENHINDEDQGSIAMFGTSSGRSVSVNQSSISKARAALEIHNYDEGHQDGSGQLPLFKSGSGKPVSVSKSSIKKARAFLENDKNDLHREDDQSMESNIFTNLERTFEKNKKFPSDGISRATTLLGLDENDLSATQLFNHGENLHRDACQVLQGLNTASGRPIAISNDALDRAKNLLGDLSSENETIFNEERTDGEIAPRLLEKDLHVIAGSRVTHGHANEVPPQIGRDFGNGKENTFAAKRKPGKIRSVTPFKKPRNSRFIAPLNKSVPFAFNGPLLTKLQNGCQKERVSTRYPFHLQRKTVREFFGGTPLHENQEMVSNEVKQINSKNAEKFVFKNGELGLNQVGSDEFHAMLIQSGALSGQATKEWVANHYKWIVWKLACYERCYPLIAAGKVLTLSNVLEELKYRYEREVNYGHRSAIKKIFDGDASPASMMVLCVSYISSSTNPNLDKLDDKTSAITSPNAKIELTDGWYSLEASLDELLTKQLSSKKIFIGQKIRILGASLCGWAGPITFLEASGTVSLSLHINGTYRATWDEPLGFCKRIGPPLAFWCVKSSGGTVPLTLVGIKRQYPLLYKERLSNGGSIVRSERMEIKALHVYHQRRSNLAEEITLKPQEICSDPNLNGTCEGARISKLIERSAEPEVLMAGMTSEQLKMFSSYQAKQQDIRRKNMSKKIENGLEQAGLGSRDVSPFMKIRVVGLNRKNLPGKARNKEGFITIWNPTEKHKMDMREGGIYHVTGLIPLNYGGDILYLQARGSSSIWKPLSSIHANHFESFFAPRKAVQLSNLGQVALASEFDLAGVVLLVGDVYLSGQQKRQWIFMTDGSGSKLEESGDFCDCILAISFFSPVIEDDYSSELFNKTLEGSTVGFLNLVKRARDQRKNIWVAETTDCSTYSLSTQLSNASHLKEVAVSAEKWAKASPLAMEKLRERVLCLVNGEGC